MRNTFVYLLGHPGVGKLTVARAICAATGARLLDNHLINNVVFSLIRADGKTPLPEGIWDLIGPIRNVAFEAIEKFGDPDDSYILTNALTDDPIDRQWFDDAAALAGRPMRSSCRSSSPATRPRMRRASTRPNALQG